MITFFVIFCLFFLYVKPIKKILNKFYSNEYVFHRIILMEQFNTHLTLSLFSFSFHIPIFFYYHPSIIFLKACHNDKVIVSYFPMGPKTCVEISLFGF